MFHLGGASYILKQIRLRRILTSSTNCEKGFYFDPVLEEKGRCQPCSEICGEGPHQIGGEDACARHKDQCEGLLFLCFEKHHDLVLDRVDIAVC